jgi:death-on-curing protein
MTGPGGRLTPELLDDLAGIGNEPTSDVPSLAASYGFGIAKNHPFVDGNKRVAFQAMYLFLGLNGLRIDASEEEVVATILSLASGDLDEPGLAAWLRDHVTPR